jgi:hypothetical protein
MQSFPQIKIDYLLSIEEILFKNWISGSDEKKLTNEKIFEN